MTQELVLVGGGHSHALVLRMWGMNPLPGVRLTLISDGFDTPYSGMLPGHVAGIYRRSECYIDLHPLAQFAGAQFYVDRVVGLDLEQRRVLCRDRPPVKFDVLSLDVGSTPKVSATVDPKLKSFAIPAKPIGQFLERWQQLQRAVQQSEIQSNLAIVGGGVGGVELALAMDARLRHQAQVHLVHRQRELLPSHNRWVRRQLRRELEHRKIQLHLGETAIAHMSSNQLPPNQLHCQSGLTLPCDWSIWVTEAEAAPWIRQSGLATDDRGFLAVNQKLQSQSHPFVFGAGDVATLTGNPHPKAGVFAVRHGKPLFENLQAYVQGRSLQIYRPQRTYLSLIGTGDGRAIASRGKLGAAGQWVWRWKDRIDRQFMDQFQNLPVMPEISSQLKPNSPDSPDSPDTPVMFCAGCGSKVGRQTLNRVLARLESDHLERKSPEILTGLEAPDDAAIWQPPGDRPLVQTIDYFRSPIADPYRFGQIATNHCLSDLFAMGSTPHSVLALATIPYGSPKIQEETLYQLLRGVNKILAPLNITLLGGHTTEGPELGFGLSCNGLLPHGNPLTKGALQPGDRLILTKPLGTGTLLAAHGRNRAQGDWLEAAIAMMLQSNHAAGAIAHRHHAHGCTDITGFGLLGHLIEMLEASSRPPSIHSLSITLEPSKIPVLPGAIACLNQGITSSLHNRNAQLQHWVSPWRSPLSAQQALLVDPQTSGGLLIAIPEQDTTMLVDKLHQAGYANTTVIGMVHGQTQGDKSAPNKPITLKS